MPDLFLQARARWGVSQPTISAQLKQLQSDLDATLLERQGRGVILTTAGQIAVDRAREIFDLGGDLLTAIHGGEGGPAATLGGGGG